MAVICFLYKFTHGKREWAGFFDFFGNGGIDRNNGQPKKQPVKVAFKIQL